MKKLLLLFILTITALPAYAFRVTGGVDKASMGLGAVQNYSPADMPLSDAATSALAGKLNKAAFDSYTTLNRVTQEEADAKYKSKLAFSTYSANRAAKDSAQDGLIAGKVSTSALAPVATSGVHNDTTGRSAADAHPISAITALDAALAAKRDAATQAITDAAQDSATTAAAAVAGSALQPTGVTAGTITDTDTIAFARSSGFLSSAWSGIKTALRSAFDTVYATAAQGVKADAALQPKAGVTFNASSVDTQASIELSKTGTPSGDRQGTIRAIYNRSGGTTGATANWLEYQSTGGLTGGFDIDLVTLARADTINGGTLGAQWWVSATPSTNTGNWQVYGGEINVFNRYADNGYQENPRSNAKTTSGLFIVPESELNVGQGTQQGYNVSSGITFLRSLGSSDVGSGRTYPSAKTWIPLHITTDAIAPGGTGLLVQGGSTAPNAPGKGIKFLDNHIDGIDFSGATISGNAIKVAPGHTISDGTITKTVAQLAAGPAQTKTCFGTDKLNAYDAATGVFTCTADQTVGAGGSMVYPSAGVAVSTGAGWSPSLNITGVSDSTSTTSSTVVASATAVKAAYDLAAGKQTPATTLAGYGITDGAVSTGKAGGQTLAGGTALGESLNISSTSHATKGWFNVDGLLHYAGATGRLLLTSNSAIPYNTDNPNGKLHLIAENTNSSDDAGFFQDMYSTTSAFGSQNFRRARGNYTTPVKVSSGDRLGGVGARGYYGTSGAGGAFPGGGTATIFFDAAEDFNDSTHLGTFITFNTTPAASGTRAEAMRVHGSKGVSIGSIADPGPGNLSALNYILAGYEEKTASYTVSKDASKITLASGTATVTLPKTLPAGEVNVGVTVAGAAASGVSFAVESGGSISWGDAGAPTFTNGKTSDVVCKSQNVAATTTAAWRCTKGGNY